MKVITKLKGFFEAHSMGVVMLFLWISAFLIPLAFSPKNPDRDKKDKLDYYDISFLSIGALFTGIAFAATYSSLIHQKKSLKDQMNLLNKQIDMNVFSLTVKELSDESYTECKKYINSVDYYDDIRVVRKITKKDTISLRDFKDILSNDIDKETKKRLRKSYDMIVSFCSKMEYIGFLFKNISTSILINYYGRTILTTYDALKILIETQNDGGKTDYTFYHFSYLYYYAKENEEKYYEERENEINRLFLK